MLGLGFGGIVLIAIVVLIVSSLRVLREYERGVVFLLGRFWRVKGPGLVVIIPVIQQMVRIDLRTVVLDVPPQDVITNDNVSVKVNAVVYFRVVDPEKAVIQVAQFLAATSQLAQTTLRAVLGKHALDELLSERERLNLDIQRVIDTHTDAWGIRVSMVVFKQVELHESVIEEWPDGIDAERHRPPGRGRARAAREDHPRRGRAAGGREAPRGGADARAAAAGDAASISADARQHCRRQDVYHRLSDPHRSARVARGSRRSLERAGYAAAVMTLSHPIKVACMLALVAFTAGARAQVASPYAIDIPAWFSESFLDFRDDVADAAKDGRRVMVYFGQDGCPYCRELMVTNFSQRAIVDKMRSKFVAIALNIWGDRETVWIDGRTRTEKALAVRLHVQFTPTLLFLDEQGNVAARLNGYWPPHKFETALDNVAARDEKREPLAAYLAQRTPEAAHESLAEEPFFMRPPFDLSRRPGSKPLAVMFETPYCADCDELHGKTLRRPEVQAALKPFDVARFGLGARTDVTAPEGAKVKADVWARDLRVTYTPAIVFFDASGREVFRIDAYLRPFHVASAFDYVASGAYKTEPSFQRYIQARADRLRAEGKPADLWN